VPWHQGRYDCTPPPCFHAHRGHTMATLFTACGLGANLRRPATIPRTRTHLRRFGGAPRRFRSTRASVVAVSFSVPSRFARCVRTSPSDSRVFASALTESPATIALAIGNRYPARSARGGSRGPAARIPDRRATGSGPRRAAWSHRYHDRAYALSAAFQGARSKGRRAAGWLDRLPERLLPFMRRGAPENRRTGQSR